MFQKNLLRRPHDTGNNKVLPAGGKAINFAVLGLFLLLVVLFAGCASTPKDNQEEEQRPFMAEWRELAEESRGESAPSREPEAREPSVFTGLEKMEDPEPEPELPRDKVSMKFRDDDVRLVLRTLAAAAEQNMVMSGNVQGTMSIDLDDIPWNQAFLSVLSINGLTYSWQGDIIEVKSREDMERDLELERTQKESQPLQTTVVDINYAHIVDWGVGLGENGFRDIGIGERDGDNLDQLETRLQDLLDDISERPGHVFVDRENNALIVQATQEDTQRVLHVFRHLDRPRKQIHIEAKIVEATQRTARELGMRWSGRYVTSGAGMDDVGIIGDSQEPTDWWSSIDPRTGEDELGGLGLGVVSGEIGGNVLFAQLQALEEDGEVNILSSPSLTTMDNQTARTEHGEEVPYRTYTYHNGTRQPDDVDEIEAGLALEVLPNVIDDQHLRMHIQVSKDEFDWTREVDGLPPIDTKRTETNTVVRSGDTIVISGLTKQTVEDLESGVPGLRNLPGLGWLFKGQDTREEMEEFMLFITPTILNDPEY